MNWLRQNPFVAGLLAVLVVGTGVLTWLITSTSSRNAEIDEQYKVQVEELQRLQKLQPYPEESSLRLLEGQREQYKAAVMALQTHLATETSPPLENLDPTVFQGQLREAVDRIVGSARATNVALPTDFYLGFDQYKSGLPTPAITPLLGFQLKQCEEIARLLIQARVSKIDEFQRALLPGEPNARGEVSAAPTPGPAAAAGGRPGQPGRPGAAAAATTTPAAPLVT
ncbi:MAG: Amuc_1100 family pilus-like protein, partial [Verrucomicrobia bacterium]|nr:Amuc_1100 family pilus-like protein [Verrucomicrobiota bacterium]